MLSGDISNGLIEFGCKRQVTAERSSAASETAAVYQLEKALVEADPTQAEVELIERCADWTKAAATICTRTIYPTGELVRWLSEQGAVEIPVDKLHINASVALAVVLSGESKPKEYFVQNSGRGSIVFAGNRGTSRADTEQNRKFIESRRSTDKSDHESGLEMLLEIAGRRAGLNHRVEKTKRSSEREPRGEQEVGHAYRERIQGAEICADKYLSDPLTLICFQT